MTYTQSTSLLTYRPLLLWLVLGLTLFGFTARAEDNWFEVLKRDATPEQLYRFLYALPKGGDLHNHLTGSGRPEWWLALALQQAERGYHYYTKVRINNCAGYGGNEFGADPYLLLFKNLQESNYLALDDCRRGEYRRLDKLDGVQKTAWLNSLRLDKPYEGRNEFFTTHWPRLRDLTANPHLVAELLVRNMQAFGAEGLLYLETQIGVRGYLKPDGSAYGAEQVLSIFRERLAARDAQRTGVTVRFQYALLRFTPDAEQTLAWIYPFVATHNDLYVGVNMVGREDNDKGYPLRFLPTLRDLRRRFPGVHLSIHAGEVDEPNYHVRDTLLLGAERIGHGVNLITDPQTLVAMRYGPYLVEINLISNLLLEYISDFSQHPFPEYLRLGVPVALSTDDRGMWDSNLSDEYYVAVTQFNLSWAELVQLGRNSLQYSFLDAAAKDALLRSYDLRVQRFKAAFISKGWRSLRGVKPVSYGFACRWATLCTW